MVAAATRPKLAKNSCAPVGYRRCGNPEESTIIWEVCVEGIEEPEAFNAIFKVTGERIVNQGSGQAAAAATGSPRDAFGVDTQSKYASTTVDVQLVPDGCTPDGYTPGSDPSRRLQGSGQTLVRNTVTTPMPTLVLLSLPFVTPDAYNGALQGVAGAFGQGPAFSGATTLASCVGAACMTQVLAPT